MIDVISINDERFLRAVQVALALALAVALAPALALTLTLTLPLAVAVAVALAPSLSLSRSRTLTLTLRAVQYAVGDALVCDTLDEARKLAYHNESGERYKVVTVDGTIINKVS